MTNHQKQRLLAFLQDAEGKHYYNGRLDGAGGPELQAAEQRFLAEFGSTEEGNNSGICPENEVLVFSLAAEGNRNLTANFKVREFACKDGSDPVFIHPVIPVWCQQIRDKFGYAFSPNSAYRTVSHNARQDVGGAVRSFHLYGLAVDIPAKGDVTPRMLYAFAEELVGDSCELGIYSWGIHMAYCKEKKRFTG